MASGPSLQIAESPLVENFQQMCIRDSRYTVRAAVCFGGACLFGFCHRLSFRCFISCFNPVSYTHLDVGVGIPIPFVVDGKIGNHAFRNKKLPAVVPDKVGVLFLSLIHIFPPMGQPAKMHVSASFGGNAAKCPP